MAITDHFALNFRGAQPRSRRSRWIIAGAVLCLMGMLGDVPLHAARQPKPGADSTDSTTLPAAASQPISGPDSKQIESLIARMSADAWKDREAAQDQLVSLGESVEPRLRELLRHATDPEVINRARSVLVLIEEARLMGPTPITLHVKNAPAAAVFKELARQAGLELVEAPPELWKTGEWPTVTLDVERADYWTVLRDLCHRVGASPQFDDGALSLTKLTIGNGSDDWCRLPAVVSGPVIVVADSVTRTNSVRFSAPGKVVQTCALELNALAEGKLHVLGDAGILRITQATDDKGNSLVAVVDAQQEVQDVYGRVFSAQVALNYPSHPGSKIVELKGAFQFVIPVKTETMEIDDILNVKNLHKTVAGHHVMVNQVVKDHGNFEAQVTLYRERLDDQQWREWCNPPDWITLLDDAGHPLLFTGRWSSKGGEHEGTFTLEFDGSGNGNEAHPDAQGRSDVPAVKPAKLVWRIPLETRELTFPFEFNNLPLP